MPPCLDRFIQRFEKTPLPFRQQAKIPLRQDKYPIPLRIPYRRTVSGARFSRAREETTSGFGTIPCVISFAASSLKFRQASIFSRRCRSAAEQKDNPSLTHAPASSGKGNRRYGSCSRNDSTSFKEPPKRRYSGTRRPPPSPFFLRQNSHGMDAGGFKHAAGSEIRQAQQTAIFQQLAAERRLPH